MTASTSAWPFGKETTAAEVLAGVDLSGRRAVVTGGASGIGIETTRALANAGAEVTIAVRNLDAGRKTAADIGRNVLVAPLDLADRASVAAFVSGWDGPLHPGGIRTNLQRYVSEEELARLRTATGGSAAPAWKTPEQGAATSALLAGSPLVEGVSARYFEDVAEAGGNQPGARTGVAAYALDPEAAARLWDVSEVTLGR